MGLRLALLTAIFCIGCSSAAPEGSPAKVSLASEAVASPKASSKEKEPEGSVASKEKGEEHAEKKDADKEKEGGKEGEEEVKGHVTVHCVPAQKQSLSVTVDSLGRTELLPENLGSLTA